MLKWLALSLFSVVALADTPPPGTVKAKTYSGDGVTSITSSGPSGALDVNVRNSISVSNAANGTPGSAAPAQSTQVGGVDIGGVLRVLKVSTGGVLSVDGSAVTQPISAAALPLPAGAATSVKQPALGTAGSASADVLTVQGISGMTALKVDGSGATQPVSGTVTANAGSGTFTVDASGHTVPVSQSGTWTVQPGNTANTTPWLATINQGGNSASVTVSNALKIDGSAVTQPVSGTITANAGTGTFAVSAASLPLPSGASTSAKQPALGTAGSASSDVLTVQGIASMTALKVDGSGVTQPVSGTVTANAGSGTFTVSGTVTANAGTGTLTVGQGTGSNLHVQVDAAPTTAVTQSGAWTVQPGNTANTTAWLINQSGRAKANAPVRNVYSSINVTTGAWVQLVASTTSATSVVCIFDSSGQTLQIGVGAAASEVAQMAIFPGGNGCEPLSIAASARVSVEALSATANTGELDINFYQ